MHSARQLANWVRATVSTDREALTHLKLQKLLFYCYGAALAFDCEATLGEIIPFEPWDHGPVNRDVWSDYKHHKGALIDCADAVVVDRYPRDVERHLEDVIDVYGAMDAWSLRQQSHLEDPWKDAYKKLKEIPTASMRVHFKKKFNAGRVLYPEYLLKASNFAVDRIPVRGQRSLSDLAASMRRATGR